MMITNKKLILYLFLFYLSSSVIWSALYLLSLHYSYLHLFLYSNDIGKNEITPELLRNHSQANYARRVPRILHQTYKSYDLPEKWEKARNSCLKHHPHWEYRFYTDDDILTFVTEHYPDQLENFRSYKQPIQRVDAFRYMLLHHYGGVYLDLDIGCKKSMDDLLVYPTLLPRTGLVGVSNDFMISEANHPFFKFVYSALPAWNLNWVSKYLTVMISTGPLFLTAQLSHYSYVYYNNNNEDKNNDQNEYLQTNNFFDDLSQSFQVKSNHQNQKLSFKNDQHNDQTDDHNYNVREFKFEDYFFRSDDDEGGDDEFEVNDDKILIDNDENWKKRVLHEKKINKSDFIKKKMADDIYILGAELYSGRQTKNNIFYHVKGSSWHSGDAVWINWLKKHLDFLPHFIVGISLTVIYCIYLCCFKNRANGLVKDNK